MSGSALLFAAAIAAFAVSLKPSAEIDLPDRAVRVSDVVSLDRLPPADRKILGNHVIATLPNQGANTLGRAAVAALVRRRVPLLQVKEEAGQFTFRAPSFEPTSERRCVALVRPIRAGQALAREDLGRASCAPVANGLVRYDRRQGTLRVTNDLAAGVLLGPIVVGETPIFEAGARLTLVSRAGPVQITRQVTALQAGRKGNRLFVRDSDGHVDAVTLDPRSSGERR